MENSNKKKENDNTLIQDITEQSSETITEQPSITSSSVQPNEMISETITEQPSITSSSVQPNEMISETITEQPSITSSSVEPSIQEQPSIISMSETIPNSSDENKLKEIIDESIQNIIKSQNKNSSGGYHRKKSKKNNKKKKLSKKNNKIKKYRHKYMTKRKSHHRRRRNRSHKNMRGGEFGASGWARTMAGSNYTEQASRVGIDGSIDMTPQNAGYPLMYQGGRKGGSVAGVLATATVPATLWASQYLYGKNKPNVYSRNSFRRSRKNRSRRFR
jgi:hypothetical protein